MTGLSYVVCTIKPWNVAAFRRRVPSLPGVWHLMETPDDLTLDRLEQISPRYIFFPHWSWRVPVSITQRLECVCLHMTDVPYGRGGSPLQNLITRGQAWTMLTALRMSEELDAGPVYLKRPLSLEGRAEEIFERAADLTYDMITEIVAKEPAPLPQKGEIVTFARRTPDDSAFPKSGTLGDCYDFIRMLDAPTYPKAFLDWGDFRIELDQARVAGAETVEARAIIRKKDRA